MHYLKCSQCGHANLLKTEYLTFCSSCNRKLENNFTEWKKQNQDKSLEEYKHLVCISESELESKTVEKRPTKGAKYWIGFIVFFAILYTAGQFGGEELVKIFRKPSLDKTLMTVASEINESCPVMIDNATRLDNTIALPENVFQYNYTLINKTKDSVDIESLRSYLQPTIINFVKTNPDMQTMRENKTTVNYYYKDMTGKYLLTISVDPKLYE